MRRRTIQTNNPPHDSAGAFYSWSALSAVLVGGLILSSPTPSHAQGRDVPAAPVAFKNQTNTTLEIHAESIVDNDDKQVPQSGVWTLKPGQYIWLAGKHGLKIYAKKFSYTVKAQGKTSRRVDTSTGPDANGYFSCTFSQENLDTHLGNVGSKSSAPTPEMEQKAKELINRNTQFLFAMAHTAGRNMTMDYQNTHKTSQGFDLKYLMLWTSSLTDNKQATNWTFEFNTNGRFKNFRYDTTWPTGGFEVADLSIAIMSKSLLEQDAVKNAMINNPNVREVIRNAKNGRTLATIWLQIDQDRNP